jgi:hypothetical protein
LVRAEPRWPREYAALALRVLVERNVAFLRDEIDLRHWFLRAFPAAPEPGAGARFGIRTDRIHDSRLEDPQRSPMLPMRVTVIGSPADSPLLDQLQGARRGVDALIRPLMIPLGLRSKVAATLARIEARGVPVRIVLDYLPADCRFASFFRGERSPHSSNLEIRHFTPLGGHSYIVDGRVAVRFPLQVGPAKDPNFGFVSEDPDFVRAQSARFEAVWDDAVPRRRARVSSEFAPPVATPPPDAASRTARLGLGEVRTVPLGGAVGRAATRWRS